jgi:hypothetical protein
MKRHLIAIALAAACATAAAAPREVAPNGFAQAREQFFAGRAGDARARDAAAEAFNALAKANPGHPLLVAYEGAAISMKARDALAPWEKMKHAEKGANLIDKALQQLGPEHDEQLFNGTPESIEVRLIAANTLLALPDFMNRRAGGRRAVEAALASPALAQAVPRVRAELYAAAARAASLDKRSQDEIAFLRKAVAADAASPAGVHAAGRLQEFGQ